MRLSSNIPLYKKTATGAPVLLTLEHWGGAYFSLKQSNTKSNLAKAT